jgi:DNA-directed RNA polymerase subunit L
MQQKTGKVNFYADSPDGETVNKYFAFKVYDLDHACDLLGGFQRKGFKIRAAYYQFPGTGKGVKLLKGLIEQAAGQNFYHLRREIEIRLQMLEREIDPQKAAERAASQNAQKFEQYLRNLDGDA